MNKEYSRMTNNEFEEFQSYWTDIKSIYGKEVSKNEPLYVFNALKEYSLTDIQNALTIVMQNSKFAPTVADVIEALKELKGEDPITLEARANKFYNELNREFSIANDIVTTDKRAVIAFYQCFTDLRDFGSHPLSADPFDKKAFVKAYVSVKPYWVERAISPQLNVIKGIYHDSEKPKVKFIGKKDLCLQICKAIYQDKKPILLEELKTLRECTPKQLTASNDVNVPEEKKSTPQTIFTTSEELTEFIKELADHLKVK